MSDIETDIPSTTCKFKLAADVDIKAKLTEFAKTNKHIAGFEITEGVN